MKQTLLSLCASAVPCAPHKMGCVFNHPSVMISLIWAITLVVIVVLFFDYLKKKAQIKKEMGDADRKHESDLKEKSFEHEKDWARFNELSQSTDEALKNRVKEMEQTISSLESQLQHEKEKEDISNNMLSVYEELFKKLKVEIVANNEKH